MTNPEGATVKPGDILDGKYQVERVLGSGGMGVVVQALHLTLKKRVAIKFMHAEQLKDGEAVARFQREAHAAASLQSEHTAQVQDTGRLQSGAPYMVMEFLVGKDLGQIVEEGGALPIDRAVELVLQACEALAEAHAKGIVHRDIKPRNLFLTQRVDGRPLLKVLDFGLAKHIETNGDHALTRTAAVMGSPQYMSPEQMRASRDVNRHTDIWSLGVCLYELLTGTVPFDAATVPMLCAMVLKDEAKPPHEIAPHVPVALSMAVMRCLQKEPQGRYADVAHLAEAIEPFAATGGRGSAARARGVLTTTGMNRLEAMPISMPVPISSARNPAFAGMDDTVAKSDTRTAASFDSRPLENNRSSRATYGIAAALGATAIASAVAIAVFLGRGKDHGPMSGASATPSHDPPPMVDVPPKIPDPAAVSPLAATTDDKDAGAKPSDTLAAVPLVAPVPPPVVTVPPRTPPPPRGAKQSAPTKPTAAPPPVAPPPVTPPPASPPTAPAPPPKNNMLDKF